MAKISFIIPCFNAEHLLVQCFNSLTAQTFKDVEFIFIDDGSTDLTKNVINEFIRVEARAKLIVQANQGITEARLTGIKYASGEFVTFLDSDDYVDATVAEDAAKLFESSEEIDAVLYSMAYLNRGSLRLFNYSMMFPINGRDIFKHSIPSWQISTMGFYRREHALNAYASIKLDAINSNEVATRLIFEPCRKIQKMKSLYYYVNNDDSITKIPSKKYVTRLESARWLRDYSISRFVGFIPRKSADVLYLNQLCEIMIKYKAVSGLMDSSTKFVWLDNISKHRKNLIKILKHSVVDYPSGIFFDMKMLKKILYIFAWPIIRLG